MSKPRRFTATTMAAIVLTAGTSMAIASEEGKKAGNYCMDVEIEPFHMLPGPFIEPESCPVRDYWDGELQEMFYPFTIEDHLLNCEFADFLTLPVVGMVPTWVVSEGEDPGMPGEISGTIDGHPFAATLYCASMTNWYQDSCADPEDPETCSFQLAQPFLKQGLPFPRVTEVSVFDGVISVDNGRRTKEVPIVMATRAAGITHVEDPAAPLVGASITHSLLGLVIDDAEGNGKGKGRDAEVLDASADLLLQGHIFFPGPVEDDLTPEGENAAAVIKGSICSEDLYKRLNRKGGQGHHD